MTFRDRVKKEHPGALDRLEVGGVRGCPFDYGYERNMDACLARQAAPEEFRRGGMERMCRACWDREMENTADGPHPAGAVKNT